MTTNAKSLLLLAALLMAAPAWAQHKRTRTTAAASKANTANTKSAASGKWAVISTNESELEFLEQDDRCLYFKYEYDDPNVYAISKETGDITMLIKHTKNYDEDALDMEVTGIGSFHDSLYVATKGARVYLYNGSDLNTSTKLLETPKRTDYFVRFAFSADGEQMAVRGKSYSGDAFVAQIRRASGKGVRGYKRNQSYRMFIDPHHRLWTQSLSAIDIVTEHSAEATAEQTFTTKDGSLGTNGRYLGDQAMCYLPQINTVLVAAGRKIYATTDSVINWHEVAKLPSDCPAQSIQVLVSNGNITYGFTDDVDNRIICWDNGFDNPPTIIPQIKTDVERDNVFMPLWSTNDMPQVHKTMIDDNGNLYMFCMGAIWVYNPQGIKGFSKARGKYTLHKKAR